MRRLILWIFGIVMVGWLLLILVLMFSQPHKRTSNKDEPLPDPLFERANHGELGAYKGLYQKHLAEKEFDLANYWLFEGALLGEPDLLDIYIRRFRGLPEEEKKKEIYLIHVSQATQKQKNALLQKLTEADPVLKKNPVRRNPL